LRNEVGHKVPAGKARTCMNGESIEGLHLLSDADNQQRHTRLLRDVSYVIVAHYEMNGDAYEDDEAKHYDMFTRRARLGQCWQQPCFGMREFIAYFDLVESEAAMPPAIPVTQELGYMLFDVQEGRRPMIFNAVLDNGVLAVPAPDSPEVLK
jgi:CRISPR-associated protein Cas5d